MADQITKIILTAVDKTREGFSSASRNVEQLKTGAASLNGVLTKLGPLTSLIGAVSFSAMIKSGIDAQDALADLSDRTGVAATTLAGLQTVAKLSDTSLEALGKGINRLSVFMADNADEAKKLGISAKDPLEAFVQFSGVVRDAETQQQRASIANKVLGRSYEELLPALLLNEQTLRAQIQAGQEYSGVTEEGVRQSQKFNDELDILKVRGAGLGVSLANDLLPSMNQVIEKMKEAAKEGGLLRTALLGLGEVGKIALFGSDAENKQLRATSGIPSEISRLSERLINDANGSKPLSYAERKGIEIDIQNLAREKNNLERELGLIKTESPDKKAGGSANNSTANAGSKAASRTFGNEAAGDYAKTYGELQKILDGTEKLSVAEETLREIQSGRYNDLLPWQRDQLANLANQVKTLDQIAAFEEAARAGDANQAEVDAERADQEREALDARERNYAELADRLREQNKSLNVDLIADDTERAKKQAELDYQSTVDSINALVLENDQRQELLDDADENYRLNLKKLETQGKSTNNVARELGLTFKSSFEEAITSGKSFRDILSGIEQDLIKVAVRKSVTEPLTNGVSNFIDSSGVGDFFSSLFASAKGNAFSGSGVHAFAAGGAFGAGEVLTSPTFFRFKDGGSFRNGVAGEAGPEAALPLKRLSSGRLGVSTDGAGGGTVVQIVDNRGANAPAVRTERSQGPDGRELVRVVIDEVRGDLLRDVQGGGMFAQSLESQYGLNRAMGAQR